LVLLTVVHVKAEVGDVAGQRSVRSEPGLLAATTAKAAEGLTAEASQAVSALISDWKVSLRARGRPRQTIGFCRTVADSFASYLARTGRPTSVGSIAGEHVEHYLADMLERGLAATVAKHYRSLQQLFKWLVDEGEVTQRTGRLVRRR